MGSNLPKCVYERRGKYYLVKNNQWIPLGSERSAAINLAEELTEMEWSPETSERKLTSYISKAWRTAINNARGRRKRDFTLTLFEVMALAKSQGFRCAVTHTPFSLHRDEFCNRAPLAPSIDRIDNSKGYHDGNVRLVCVAANYAMNQWGEGPLRVMMSHMRRRKP